MSAWCYQPFLHGIPISHYISLRFTTLKDPFNSTMFGGQRFNINTQIILLQKLTIYETCNPFIPELNAQCDAQETRM